MKKIIALLLLTFNFVFSQSNYKPAYYISNSGTKVEGYVLYSDLQEKDNLNFKTDLKNESLTINIKDFTEIIVGNNEKFISRNVEYAVNRLTDSSDFIKENNDPLIKSQQLLLSILVEGDASLYVGAINDINFYFIKMANSEKIIHLLYYKYKEIDAKADNGYRVYENNGYKRQLLQYANCASYQNLQEFNSVGYFENDLKKAINKYNVCKNGTSNDLTNNIAKQKIKIAAIIGAKFQDVHLSSKEFYGSPQSKTNFSPSIGLELSYLIPTKSLSTEVFFRINFDKVDYQSTAATPLTTGTSIIYEKWKLKSNFLHFDLGSRYYFNSRNNHGVFIEGAFAYTMLFSDEFGYYVTSVPNSKDFFYFETNSYVGANLGLGYLFAKKYSINVGYNIGTEFSKVVIFKNSVSSFGVNLKYIF